MNKEKVLGTLYGAAYGDSLGAITEFTSIKEIKTAFPKGHGEYTKSISVITKDITPGCVTDDFGSSSYLMKHIIKNNGDFNRDIAMEAILDWSSDPIVFAKYAGSNTKGAIERLAKGIVIDEKSRNFHFLGKNTNGGAMKVSPVALLSRGDLDQCIIDTADLCWPTHYNSAAVSGACAIACAIAKALDENASIDDIIEAGIYGAGKSRLQLEKEGYESLGPYVEKRIENAVSLMEGNRETDEIIEILYGTIGTGISVQESIPAVFAIIKATNGNFNDAVKVAVNAGGDTDTIASMTGAILGARNGIGAIDAEAIKTINEKNEFLNLKELIDRYANMICEGEQL